MLETVDQVIKALGGTFKAAAVANVGPSAVSNWKSRGRIPSDRFLLISAALERDGKKPAPELFGFAGEVAA